MVTKEGEDHMGSVSTMVLITKYFTEVVGNKET